MCTQDQFLNNLFGVTALQVCFIQRHSELGNVLYVSCLCLNEKEPQFSFLFASTLFSSLDEVFQLKQLAYKEISFWVYLFLFSSLRVSRRLFIFYLQTTTCHFLPLWIRKWLHFLWNTLGFQTTVFSWNSACFSGRHVFFGKTWPHANRMTFGEKSASMKMP